MVGLQALSCLIFESLISLPFIMTANQSIKIYEILAGQFSQPEKARELTEAIEAVIAEKVEKGTKDYEVLLHKDLQILKSENEEKLAGLEGRLRTDIAEVKINIAEVKADIMKWMFIFWVGSFIGTLGGLIAIVRFMVVK